MCSILGIFDIQNQAYEMRKKALELSGIMRHRGPDWSGIYACEKTVLVHERLSIVGLDSGTQPLYNKKNTHVAIVNGEIYNHQQLRSMYSNRYNFKTDSDSEVVLALYQEKGPNFIDDLEGMFAFALYDIEQDAYLIARDHIGIVPLYMGHDEHGNFYIASEIKALVNTCRTVEEFPTGSYLWSKDGEIKQYYQRDWFQYDSVQDNRTDEKKLRSALEKSIKSHLMSEVDYGVLLSGGLDSSLIAAITKKFSKKGDRDLHSFAIGLKGSPDLKAAQEVADYLGTLHHEMHFSVQEGLDAVRDVIYHIETYDVTTIRASTPMYLMSRQIKALGIKMILSGEGSDEVFGGYLYFHKAPDARSFHEETVRKVKALHMFDCARANKAMYAFGVEARVPFLDKEFLDVAMRINPTDKMCNGRKIEKHILRSCFADYLPEKILWRQKEQFSDGVGYNWIDSLKELSENQISDQKLETARFRFPHNTPTSKEAYLYREIFDELFPIPSAAECIPGGFSIACSSNKVIEWDKSFQKMNDPSGRAVIGIHQSDYNVK